MEIILELICAFFIELIGTSFFEATLEIFVRFATNTLGIKKRSNPILSFIGYTIIAFFLGSISIGILDYHILKSEPLQIINLVLVPILIGLIMKYRGDQLEKKNKERIHLNSFIYGFSFALTFLLVRYFLIKT